MIGLPVFCTAQRVPVLYGMCKNAISTRFKQLITAVNVIKNESFDSPTDVYNSFP